MRHAIVATFLCLTFHVGSAHAQDDVGQAETPICCGANCCIIASGCFTRGQANPADGSLVCDPSCSQTDWTPSSGCGPAESDAGGGGTDAGSGGTDAGSGGGDGGGGCSVSPRTIGGAGASWLLLFAAAASLSRRRRA